MPKLDSASDYARRGWSELTEGDEGCAMVDCESALALDPKNPDALICRGAIYRKREQFDSAKEDLDHALEISPKSANALYQRSELYRATKSYDLALADIDSIIEQLPDSFYYAARGVIYFELGKYEKAVEDYTEAIRLYPENAEYYAKRSEIYRYMKQTELAESDEQKAKELDLTKGFPRDIETEESDAPVLNDKAVNLPKPVYPPSARAVKASGEVKVEIETDAKGNVISAKSVSGHPLLRASAEAAAKKAKLKPEAMKGILIFNFDGK